MSDGRNAQDPDKAKVREFLDLAQVHSQAENEFGEGYNLGRAVQHANQNALSAEWLASQLAMRGLSLTGLPS